MKIYIITETYPSGVKYVCSTYNQLTCGVQQVFAHKGDAEAAANSLAGQAHEHDKFIYEVHELGV